MARALRVLDGLIAVLAAAILVASLSMILLNVVNRYVVLGWLRASSETSETGAWLFETADAWLSPLSATADEVPGLLLVWIAFLGAYLCYRRGGHIAFDMLVEGLPAMPRRAMQMATDATVAGFLIMLLYQSIRMIMVDGETEIETAEIGQGWFMLILPLSAALMTLAVAIDFANRLRAEED